MLWWPCSRLIVPRRGPGSSQILMQGKYIPAGRWQDTVTHWMPPGAAALRGDKWHCHQLRARGPPHGSALAAGRKGPLIHAPH